MMPGCCHCTLRLYYSRHDLTCSQYQDTAMPYIVLIFCLIVLFRKKRQAEESTVLKRDLEKMKKRDSYHRDIYVFLYKQFLPWTSLNDSGCHSPQTTRYYSVRWTRLLSEVFIIVTFSTNRIWNSSAACLTNREAPLERRRGFRCWNPRPCVTLLLYSSVNQNANNYFIH